MITTTTWHWMGWKTSDVTNSRVFHYLPHHYRQTARTKSLYLTKYCNYDRARFCGMLSLTLGFQKKLVITTHGKVRYPLKTPCCDGITGDWRSHVIFEPLNFIDHLAALVPKPRINLTRLDEKHPCFSSYEQS